jgi:hypothetical protein
MRDPERIERILEKLKTVWVNQPDTRLLQLLINILTREHQRPDISKSTLYFLEDGELELALDSELNIVEWIKTIEFPPKDVNNDEPGN